MELTIIGAGPSAGTIGAYLIRTGTTCCCAMPDEAHVDRSTPPGSPSRAGASFTVPARAVTPDGLPGTLMRVEIAVKSHHTAQAANCCGGRLAPDGYVVSFPERANGGRHH